MRITLASVPRDVAEAVCSGLSDHLLGHRPPLTAFGLHKHECKLSVVNMTVTRIPEYDAPVANKEEVLIVTGLRTHQSRPILSSDDYNADKHKLERFMHAGRPYVMSAYAPISFGPMPVLVFKQVCCSCCLVSCFTQALASLVAGQIDVKWWGYNADKHKLEPFMHPGRPYGMCVCSHLVWAADSAGLQAGRLLLPAS